MNNVSISFQSNDINSNIKVDNEKKKVRGGASGLVALLGSSAASCVATPITLGAIMPAMVKAGKLPADQVSQIHEGALKALKKTGLEELGVKVEFLPKLEGKPTFLDLSNPIISTQKGLNAAFLPKDVKAFGVTLYPKNTIIMPEKDISYALYHEMGHAHNFNKSSVLKLLQKCRPVSMLLPVLIATYGAFSRKSKPKDGEELTSAQKTNNFIRDNAGKLSLVATIPMLVEEAAATIKGQKWAKEFLSPDLAKKVLKGNSIAYGSYLLTAASLVFASWTAVKIKDKLIAKKEQKQAEQEKLANLA